MTWTAEVVIAVIVFIFGLLVGSTSEHPWWVILSVSFLAALVFLAFMVWVRGMMEGI